MLMSSDHDTLKKCIASGILPAVLERNDVILEIVPTATPQQFLDNETGEIVTYEQMKAAGGTVREKLELHLEPPMQPYFRRDMATDTVICPMGQTLFYAGIAWPGGKADASQRRYHRACACAKCNNKCTVGKQRIVSFKDDETQKRTDFYDKCGTGRITRRKKRRFVPVDVPKRETVVLKYYPNQRKLRIRNQVVEHPFGTVKRWNDGHYLLVKGRVKAAAEIALSYLGYNFKRVLNLLGMEKMMAMVTA